MPSVIQPQGNSSLPGELTSLQNSRYKVVTKEPIQSGDTIPQKNLALGTAYSAVYAVDTDETAFANLKLVSQYFAADTVNRAQAILLVREFQTLTNTFVAEVDDKEETAENGLKRITRVLIAEAGTAHSSYVVGTSTYSGLTLAQKLVEENDAYVRVTLVYGAAGVLSRITNTSNNGALTTIVIESANEVPSTPSGYTLVSTQVVGEAGFETTRYTFAKGDGQISQEDVTSNNGALLTRTIRHLTAPGTLGVPGANPISTPSGYTKVSESYQEQDGYRIWTASYARGNGQVSEETQGQGDGVVITIRHLTQPAQPNPISTPSGYLKVSESYQEADGHRIWTAVYGKGTDVTDYDLNGLKRITRTIYSATGTSTTAYVVGTQTYGSAPTLYLARVRIEDNGIYQRVVAEYLQPGNVSTETRLLDGGIKQTTVRAFYSQPTISNAIVVSTSQENELGYPVWQVVGLTKLDGTSLASGTALTVQNESPFTYPGRAKPYTVAQDIDLSGPGTATWNFYDVFLSPPVEATIPSTTTISYSTNNNIGTLANTLWNPTEWATVRAFYAAGGADQYRLRIEALRGYRTAGGVSDATDPASVSGTSDDPTDCTVMGDWVTFGTSFQITVAGGPPKPDGNTYTLRYSVEPAFVSTAGTQYYRHTITTATIPAQDALPV